MSRFQVPCPLPGVGGNLALVNGTVQGPPKVDLRIRQDLTQNKSNEFEWLDETLSLWSLQTGESMAWLPSVSLENKKNNGNKGLEHTVPRWARVTQFEVQILGGSTSSFQCVVTATPSSDFTRDKVVVTDKTQLNWVCLATKTLKCWDPQTNMAMENHHFS